ncbi:MAG TPA: DegQ family serine endoprotease [Vicinamibacterales bacterium]|nr:DegQ family serine endoprotease [Vicinamibacterales bacterium]
MNGRYHLTPRALRTWAAAAAVTLLMGGATWHSMAVTSAADEAVQAVAQPKAAPVTHAVAAGRDSYADVVDMVSPAVVTVHASGRARVRDTQFQLPDDDFLRRFFGQNGIDPRRLPRPRENALGSGVVVSSDGYILTNNHVVEGADDISIDFTDGRTMTAKLVGTDNLSDLALLKVAGSDFRAIKMGDSNAVRVGDIVLAVGNPLNVGQTVTMGIISAKGRSAPGPGNGSYEDFLQTDAPINHGNSGGALVNLKGELVGINSQIVSVSEGNIGIGFAIPANMAKRVMDDLRTSGKVTRSQLGIGVQNVSPDMAANLGFKGTGGVIVSSVTPGSAAEHAGLKVGDVITSLNGQPVRDMNTLRNRVAEAAPGSNAELVIFRDGAEKKVTAKLEELDVRRLSRNGEDPLEPGKPGSGDRTALGISVSPMTPELAQRLGVPRTTKGLVVQDVDPDGRAVDAGIREGDIIQEVNRQPVASVEELRAAVRQSADKPALLLINREGTTIFATVKPANG